MKAKATKLAAICLAGALIASVISSPVNAAKKVTIKGSKKITMKVGTKKKFKANQKVKWTVKGKSIKIVKGKNAKTVTVQAKKKGTSTLTAKKNKKKATVKIQVTKKAADDTNTNTKTDVSASSTDMTKLTSENFYKVTKVSGKDITVVSSDNKEYTTTMKSDIPVWREDAILTDASAIQAGEYFKCTAFTYTEGTTKKTSYAALVISESNYQNIVKCRIEKKKDYYTMNVATFYVIKEDAKVSLAAYQNGPAVVKSVYADEDTAVVVNGVKEYNGCGKLKNGMRVLVQYGWEDQNSAGNLINVNSIIAY